MLETKLKHEACESNYCHLGKANGTNLMNLEAHEGRMTCLA